jgi:hypothetical protein
MTMKQSEVDNAWQHTTKLPAYLLICKWLEDGTIRLPLRTVCI